MKQYLRYGLFAYVIAVLGAGCTREETMQGEDNATGKIIITGSIEDAVTAQSRVDKDEFGSYLSGGFSVNDQVGFYSQYNAEGGSSGFNNVCLTYTQNYQVGDSDEYYQSFTTDPDNLLGDTPSNLGNVFAYYPYNAENTGNDIKIYNEDNTVIDLLIASSTGLSGGLIHFGFTHAFSMLFIFPDSRGFSKAMIQNPKGIKVVLEKGVINATVKDDRRILTLNKSDNAPKEFTAIKNPANATINDDDSEGYDEGTFFYVLLPSETTVDYIEIVDDFGKKQYVRPASSQLPTLARGIRYPITIYMEGDQPTVWPWDFSKWNQETIKEERSAGIYDATDLAEWISAYNTYCENGKPKPEEGADAETVPLLQYGDYNKEEGAETGKWNFRLNADIDCSQLDITSGATLLLNTFSDALDGRNHTLSNLTLSGSNTGIIGTLAEGGSISNLKLENVTITADSDDSATSAIGGIANSVTGGTITNCDISGLRITGNGPVGAITGNISAGSIMNNTCSGVLIGASSEEETNYIAGSVADNQEESLTLQNNRTANLIFQSTQTE